MIESRLTSPLLFVPTGDYVEARVVGLTAAMADVRIHQEWWSDECLKRLPDPPPIDRYWNWNEMDIEYGGRALASEKVAVVVGDDESVQGAMLISTEPVKSVLAPNEEGLFVELLFTAPRNRPSLRADGREFLKGVGTELLTWAAWFSRESGCHGRLLLDGSPDFI